MGLLNNKVALVTGGGSGMGRAVAVAFAREGAKVVLCGRRDSEGAETVSMIKDAGGEGQFVRTDISKADQVEALVAHTVGAYGRLDVAFNNAGVGEGSPALAELTEEKFDYNMNINIRGTFLCLKYEIAQMMKQGGGGSIINNASIQSHMALGASAHYTASKHAVLGYTRAAAVDYAPHGIRVNAIAPGIVLTPMMAGFDPEAPEVAGMMARIPAGRVAVPEDIVGPVLFLASDMSAYVYGASLAVDGGWLAH
ncbi:MAG: SDR family oxidoreductase [Sphingomonadales bacterium]